MNRLSTVKDNMIGTEDPDDLMLELMDVLGDSVTPVPDVGNFYIQLGFPWNKLSLGRISPIYMG